MDFIYDESGRPFALKYSSNGGSTFTTYYYILNLQGDVVKLVQILASPSGIQEYSEVASYTYDAWGNILSSTGNMADINPLRYRGYYYDTETGFYYLQSRYYDPATHRFINADSYASTGQGLTGTNMFAYCNNNPITYVDTGGCTVESVIAEGTQEVYINGLIVTIKVEITAKISISDHVSVNFSDTGLGCEVNIGGERQFFTLKNQFLSSSRGTSVAWKYSDCGIMLSLDLVEGATLKSDPIPLNEHLDMYISISIKDAVWYDDFCAWLNNSCGAGSVGWGAGSNIGYTGGGAVYAEGGGVCGLGGIRGRYLAII